MSKRQSDYLSALLNDALSESAPDTAPLPSVSAPPPSSAPASTQSAATLMVRESALARVASGEVRQVTQLWLDPARVRIWGGNPRHQASLTEHNCRDLIDAILAEGGQKVPAIVRRVEGDLAHDYEVIAGSRRHFAISWLRANSYPDLLFLAQVYTLDDEAAFRISDIENRARKDVSDFERARTYLKALDLHYGGKQVRMIERLRLSKGWLSKMLTVGALPDWAVSAFATPADIQLATCYPLAQRIQALEAAGDTAFLEALREGAAKIAALQANRQAEGIAPVTAAEVVRLLTHTGKTEPNDALVTLPAPSGRVALSVTASNRNGVSLRLHAGSGASEAELMELFRQALMTLTAQGKGLKP
ncbi:ParB/RepB/Spo0J family partition protein [Asticcacaulis sp. SL142]|uniref:ParB/RepB/Spo0J family partition protein n=1 Tax=Asticcacaulis sp. SL142 TaxID=2995155 RepID=UPI00226CDD15|nr:ParB/RepB/Spo0J family partition protein [Asticcacaulis sp. SL142]WAC47239.1 ParB/RepB/Spo0J family partition protein [Asticcacaulis sp. SL142]